MKVLVVLAAVVACALAKPGVVAYTAGGLISQQLNIAAPLSYAAAPVSVAAPLSYAAAPVSVAAPVSYAAAPVSVAAPVSYAAAPVSVAAPVAVAPSVTATQYHAQDELGQASYGYAQPGQVHNAVRDAAGNVAGSYSYVAPNGQVLTTNYVADGLGFRVASNALPVGPGAIPVPVQDTPEVQAARAAHLAAVAQVRSRAKRQVVVANHAAVAAPLAYSAIAPAAVAYNAAPVAAVAAPAAVAYNAAPVAAVAAPAGIPATLTTVVNNPGHAVSYRVD